MSNSGKYGDGNFVALTACFYCGEAGDLLLHTHFKDISEVHGKITSMRPCSNCEGWMKENIIILGVSHKANIDLDAQQRSYENGKSEWLRHGYNRKESDYPGFVPDVPRAGFFVVSEDFMRRVAEHFGFSQALLDKVLKCRWTFMDDVVLELAGVHSSVDKPEEVPFRKECARKGVDPHEEACRIIKERQGGEKEKAQAEQTTVPEAPAATGEDSSG